MSKIYIEYHEERMETMNVSSFFGQDENEDEGQEGKMESIMFAPLFAYRTPFENAIELDTSFDVADLKMVHLVVVRYEEKDNICTEGGKWHIYGVYPTRREAVKNSEIIDSEEDLWKDMPWDKAGCSYEGVDVISVMIED